MYGWIRISAMFLDRGGSTLLDCVGKKELDGIGMLHGDNGHGARLANTP